MSSIMVELGKLSNALKLFNENTLVTFQRQFSTCFKLSFREFGDPLEVLKLDKKSRPPPGSDEVQVKHIVASANPADVNLVQGVYSVKVELPPVDGVEGVCEVIEVGSNVKSFKPGHCIIPNNEGFGTLRTFGNFKTETVFKRQQVVRFLTTKSGPPDAEYFPSQTHFGYETVDEKEKSMRVYEVFEKVADSYDKMNDAMSFGVHRAWKHILIQRLNPPPGTKLLDVAGGSGDIAFRFLDYVKKQADPGNLTGHVTVCDINEAMLDVGKSRAQKLGYVDQTEIDWVRGDAENLPVESESVSAYTISFGIRNVTRIEKALDEAYRVLKPGGRFMCLEFSQINNELLKRMYDSYSFAVIPVMGQVIAGQWKPYQYLVESIRKFPDQMTFKKMIENAGFRSVTYENLTFGVVAIHSGFKL